MEKNMRYLIDNNYKFSHNSLSPITRQHDDKVFENDRGFKVLMKHNGDIVPLFQD